MSDFFSKIVEPHLNGLSLKDSDEKIDLLRESFIDYIGTDAYMNAVNELISNLRK